MNEMMTTLLFISSEIAVGLMVVVSIIVVMFLKKRKARETTARTLFTVFKSDEEEKREKLKLLLNETLKIEGEEADANIDGLTGRERELYKQVLNMYMGRNDGYIHEFSGDLQKLTQSYHALLAIHAENSAAGVSSNEGDEAVRERNRLLVKDNERLKDELKIALETIDNIMHEFANMYEGGEAARNDPVARERIATEVARVEGIRSEQEDETGQSPEAEDTDSESAAGQEAEPADETLTPESLTVSDIESAGPETEADDDLGFDMDSEPDIVLEENLNLDEFPDEPDTAPEAEEPEQADGEEKKPGS